MDFFELTKQCTKNVINHKNEEFHIVSHMDADGISSCAILSKAFERAGIEHTFSCMKLNELSKVPPSENMVFCDLGSGQQQEIKQLFSNSNITIIDHHQFERSLFPCHFNPFLVGIDGGTEVSGSGMSYFFSKALDHKNVDLSQIAIVGAIGDMQALWGRLEGLNRSILDDGIKAGVVTAAPDLLLYGRYTRPIFKSLQYFSDPPIPGVSGSESNAVALLGNLDIDIKEGDWRTLSDLSFEEKQRLGTELIRRILSELPKEFVHLAPKLVFGEAYSFECEDRYSPLRDASEFSTCLNAAGRHNHPEIGVEVAKGNRGIYFDKLKILLKRHRRKLAQSISLIDSRGISHLDNIQYFDGTGITDALVGTVAGMMLGSEECNPFIPLIGYTPIDDSTIKISVRCSKLLVHRNLNMGTILRDVAANYGGVGGGHAFACGAYIPFEHITAFLHDISLAVGASIT